MTTNLRGGGFFIPKLIQDIRKGVLFHTIFAGCRAQRAHPHGDRNPAEKQRGGRKDTV